VKRSRIFRARLVTCGYSKVPGVHFNEILAPVINDVSFRILLIVKLVWNMKATTIDIETDFLPGNVDKEIYIEVLPGLDVDNSQKLFLRKNNLRSSSEC
jgi:hypothetical protein